MAPTVCSSAQHSPPLVPVFCQTNPTPSCTLQYLQVTQRTQPSKISVSSKSSRDMLQWRVEVQTHNTALPTAVVPVGSSLVRKGTKQSADFARHSGHRADLTRPTGLAVVLCGFLTISRLLHKQEGAPSTDNPETGHKNSFSPTDESRNAVPLVQWYSTVRYTAYCSSTNVSPETHDIMGWKRIP